MPRPEPAVRDPERATLEDIDALNRLFTESFTDRYYRDGMTGVRVPPLSRDVWRYAIEDAGEGALVWRDVEGQLVAFNMVHRSGAEGWMGPLCVRPSLQGAGLGRRIVGAGIAWLRRKGATVIGLETMPRTVDNIGFYSRLGFVPGHLTVTLQKDLERSRVPAAVEGERLSRAGARRAERLRACAALTDRLAPGVDYTREMDLTEELRLGDTTLLVRGAEVAGFALWQTAPLAQGRVADEFRVLKVVAGDVMTFREVLAAVERFALERGGIARVGLRCQSAYAGAYAALIEDAYRVQWTDLRMTLAGAGERVEGAGVVMSNWEI